MSAVDSILPPSTAFSGPSGRHRTPDFRRHHHWHPLVKDINPGSFRAINTYFSKLTNPDGILYFSANDGHTGPALWKSVGTSCGSILARSINPDNFLYAFFRRRETSPT